MGTPNRIFFLLFVYFSVFLSSSTFLNSRRQFGASKEHYSEFKKYSRYYYDYERHRNSHRIQFVGLPSKRSVNVQESKHQVTFLESHGMRELSHLRRRRAVTYANISVTVPENASGSLFNINTYVNNIGARQYVITESSLSSAMFEVTSSGQVNLKQGQVLDYENTAMQSIRLVIQATSPTNSSDVYAINVILSVTNVNEPPVFVTKPTPYLARVTSSAGTGSIVIKLTAVDPESISNVQYQIVSVNPSSFSSGFQVGTVSETDPTYGSVTSCQVRTNDASVLKPDNTDITIIISASDGTNPTQTSVAVRVGLREPQIYQTTFLGVIAENNQPDQMVYVQGSENNPLVIQVKTFQEGELTYELRSSSGTESAKFYVSGDGIVRSRDILDLESPTSSTPSLQMTVIVRQLIETTTTLSSTGTVIVTIQDMNDNAPVFDIPQYTTRISEATAIGFSVLEVKASDRDSGSNSAIDYSFIEAPNTTDSFNITTVQTGNSYIGIIKVKKTLDYDRRPLHLYEFKVVATDRGKPTALSGTTNVQIIVTNVNDEAPEFITRPDPIRLQDTTAVGQVIIQMQARDLDGDRVKYYFTPNLPQVYRFTINQDTGIITLAQPIQTIDTSFTLNITAVDDGSCCGSLTSLSSSTSIVVQVVGSNTHKPTFTWCANYSLATVTENSPNGTFIVTVQADDPDRGENGKVTYELTQPTGKFGINSETCNVTVIVPIDREKETSKFIQVTVKASDNGQPRLDGWCTFRVEIIDVNDNSPVFDKTEYVANITSDTQVSQTFTVIRANDSDTGANAEIEYSLLSDVNGTFGIISTNGFIYLKKTLSPNIPTYKLVAMAKDKGVPPLNTTVSITVNIKAGLINQPPQWDTGSLNITNITSIEQTRPDTPIISDLRCRSNVINDTRVEFQLISEGGTIGTRSNYFYIQDNGTSVTLYTISSLNYEQQTFQEIRLRCLNYGPLALWTEINPRIQLIDQNNKVPIFTGIDSNGRFSGSVGENQTAGQEVITVQAEDADITPSFRNLSFEIVQDSGVDSMGFTIVPNTNNKLSANIKTTRVFDREVQNFYTIKVRVKDGAPSVIQPYEPGPNTATVVVQIFITDINDNPPSFKLPLYNLTVKEDHDLLTPILPAITADDLDEINIGHLEYFIESGNGVPPTFGVSTGTGLFYLVRKLDYDSKDKIFQLVLRAFDGIYSATTTVTITVLDVNDNSPTFSQNSYIVNDIVEEDQTLNGNLPILQVNATDADVNRPDEIRYSLLDGRDSKYFRIDAVSGQLYLTSTLDRDRQEGPSFSITVQAVDEPVDPNYGYTTVIVNPKDINDNDPSFKTSPLQGSVKENSPPNTSVMLIQAQDPDLGENGTVYFKINRIFSPPNVDHAGYFLIDSRSGIIWTNASSDKLDRERESTYYIVTVIYDGGNPSHSSTGTVTISLDDINDNSPVFQQHIYRTEMSENQRAGSIITVRANDSDIGNNARLTYRLVSTGSGTQYFQIDSINTEGIINIYRPVDYENPSQRFFNLTVSVEDPDPSHSDTCYVEITVTDFNDNAPEITMQWALKDVSEVAPVDTLIANFTAKDRDSGINGQFEFSIARDSDRLRQFKIVHKDQFSAEVRIRQPLDRETVSSYNLHILAIDIGNPQMTGSAIIPLDIRDVNDNYPTFKDNYQPQVRENLANPRTLVQKILGKDPDASPYGPPFGFRLGSCADNLCLCTSTPSCQEFEFFTDNGDGGNGSASVYSLVEFDREKQKYYLIPVFMWDMRGTNSPESMTGTNTLTVTIGDINDNPMSAGQQDMFVYNYKGLFGDIEIGRVYVQDLDDWDLPDKNFTFVEPDWMKAYFTVNTKTGMVTMKKGVPNNLGGKPYTFTVDVTDSVWNSKVRSSVSVIIEDLSEQAVASSGAVRLSGTSAEEFIKRPQTGESQYDTFRKLLAQKLQTTVDNVQIVSIMNVGEYTDVRYSAHSLPYYQSSQIDSILVANKDQFESDVNIKIVMVPIDTCAKEVFEGGCYNFINITDRPILVNSNGTSYVGVEVLVQTKEGCRGEKFPDPEQCSGDYCYHGGTCLKDDFGKLSCQCLSEFDGPRCQQLRHSFNGTGYAMYPMLEQCENSQTSIEFITTQGQGLLLYNGPTEELTADEPQDFISLELVGGYPVLNINHGSGALMLTLTTTNTLADGKWHHIDIYRQGRNVEMVVDFCKTAAASNSTWLDTRSCRAAGQTPGDNSFLNVATLLQLGGRHSTPSYPPNIGSSPFNGCVRNLRHNTKLYDLYYKSLQGAQSGENGCPREDSICGTTCGTNGVCSASFTPPVVQSCVCKPGFRESNCHTATTVRDLRTSSYLQWSFNPTAAGVLPYELEIQAMFRTRDDYGAIFSISSADNSKTIILEIVNNTLQVTYNLGSGDQVLKLPQATISNGQWHVVNVKRRVQHVTLSLDGGEGRNYATSRGSLDSPYSMTPSGRPITGAVLSPAMTVDRDLINTCLQDIRVNSISFPMKTSENIPNVVEYLREQNMLDGCTRDGCGSVTCPANMVCYPLWDKGECRCNHGYYLMGTSICTTNCDPNPCFNGMACSTSNGSVVCNCTFPWYGTLCQHYPLVETTASTTQVTTSHGHHDITCTESRMEFSIPLSSPHTSETATLSDPNCQINLTRTHVRGGVDLNSCGTTVQFQNDSVIFRNAIIFSAPASSSLDSNGSDVSQFQDIIPIECVYNRIATVHLSYMPVVRRVLFTESGVGQFSFNIQQFWDASFTSVVSDRAYPLRLEQDADIFIQLSVGSEGQPVAGHKEIGMEVQQCLVSPSSSVIEAQLHYYPLIQDGCPASSDVHIIPNTNASDSTVMRFRFRAVNFFDPSSSSSSSLVFVHCRMGLCLTGSCKPSAWTCLTPPARRVRRDVDQSRRAAHQLSTGPFLIMADEASASSSSTTATVMAVVSTSVATVAIVVAAIALIALRRRRTTARN